MESIYRDDLIFISLVKNGLLKDKTHNAFYFISTTTTTTINTPA